MTIEEAVNELDELTMYVEHAFTEEHKRKSFDALQMSIESLKKQIPTEPLDFGNEEYLCPCCKRNNFYKSICYCDYCGQAIKWK